MIVMLYIDLKKAVRATIDACNISFSERLLTPWLEVSPLSGVLLLTGVWLRTDITCSKNTNESTLC